MLTIGAAYAPIAGAFATAPGTLASAPNPAISPPKLATLDTGLCSPINSGPCAFIPVSICFNALLGSSYPAHLATSVNGLATDSAALIGAPVMSVITLAAVPAAPVGSPWVEGVTKGIPSGEYIVSSSGVNFLGILASI